VLPKERTARRPYRFSSTTKKRCVVLPTSTSLGDAGRRCVAASAIEASFGEVGLAVPRVAGHAA